MVLLRSLRWNALGRFVLLASLAFSTSSADANFEDGFEDGIDLKRGVDSYQGPEPTREQVEESMRQTRSTFLKIETQEESGPPGGEALAFCHGAKWSSTCLLALMTYRCHQYTFPALAPGCTLAATQFMKTLELVRIDVTLDGYVYNLPLIFHQRLERMIQSKRIQKDLNELRMRLDYSAETKKPLNLWEWAAQANGRDLGKTIEWLAVLLQDTSRVQIHLAYLDQIKAKRKFNADTLAAIENLRAVNAFLYGKNLSDVDSRSWLGLYPTVMKIDEDVTYLIYHVYPMALLAWELNRTGYGERLSAFLPFLFNTEYLLQELNPKWPFRHPSPGSLDPSDSTVAWKMRDLYGGLVGGLIGVNRIAHAPGLARVQSSYIQNPYRTMRSYFWNMPRF